MVSNQDKKQKVFKELEVFIPLVEGVSANYKDEVLTIKGPKGEISKILRFPRVYLKVENNKVLIGTKRFSQSEKKIIFTYRAHVKNLIKGVTEGFIYKLVVVYAKFPISIQLKGNNFTVKNFLGEKVPRSFDFSQNVKVEIKNNKEIIVSGINKEEVGQVAARIEQLTKISHLDRRVVQDGIFITEKPHMRYA